MHEFSLAQRILEIVREHVSPSQEALVRRIHLQVGRLAGVVPESLAFCWEALVSESPLRDARLEIETLPLRIHCANCHETFTMEHDVFACPVCAGGQTSVVSGMELLVAAIAIAGVTP